MYTFIIILLSAFLALIISIYLSRRELGSKNIDPKNIEATACVIVNHNKVETLLEYNKNNKNFLYALALLAEILKKFFLNFLINLIGANK